MHRSAVRTSHLLKPAACIRTMRSVANIPSCSLAWDAANSFPTHPIISPASSRTPACAPAGQTCPVRVSRRAEGNCEPEDHLASICEMMSGLCLQSTFAVSHDEEQDFFKRHVEPGPGVSSATWNTLRPPNSTGTVGHGRSAFHRDRQRSLRHGGTAKRIGACRAPKPTKEEDAKMQDERQTALGRRYFP